MMQKTQQKYTYLYSNTTNRQRQDGCVFTVQNKWWVCVQNKQSDYDWTNLVMNHVLKNILLKKYIKILRLVAEKSTFLGRKNSQSCQLKFGKYLNLADSAGADCRFENIRLHTRWDNSIVFVPFWNLPTSLDFVLAFSHSILCAGEFPIPCIYGNLFSNSKEIRLNTPLNSWLNKRLLKVRPLQVGYRGQIWVLFLFYFIFMFFKICKYVF